MFTLKLYKRLGDLTSEGGPPSQLVTKIMAVDNVQVMEIGLKGRLLELWAFHHPLPSTYDVFYIGETEPGMVTHDDWHSQQNWGWGLLENERGSTTQHFRPASYG